MSRVYVAGSINMDLVTRAHRHPRAGETVLGRGFATYPGGKGANQAVASAKLGAQTIMLGKVGTDAFGDQARRFLHGQGVKVDYVQRTGDAPTGVALIVVSDSGENSIVVVPGANGLLGPGDVEVAPVEKGDVVVSQFEIPLATIERLFTRCRTVGATTILNPAPGRACSPDLLALANVLILNETEIAFFLGVDRIDLSSLDAVATAANRLRAHPEQVLVATLGVRGVLATVGERRVSIPGRRVKAIDTTGAGDSFTGATAARLAAGCTLESALAYANAAASICVQRQGAGPSMATAEEVEALVAG